MRYRPCVARGLIETINRSVQGGWESRILPTVQSVNDYPSNLSNTFKAKMFQSIITKTAEYLDRLVSVIIFVVAIRLVVYMLTDLLVTLQDITDGQLWISGHDAEMLDWIVFYIVMVKAYRVLISYSKYHHISICYIMELAIIACFVEFIFEQSISETFRIILGAVGLGSLFLYLFFYNTIKGFDETH